MLMFSAIMFFVIIGDTHAASLGNGKAFQTYVETNEIPIHLNERKNEIVAETPMLITEPNQKPLEISRPFVLWWSVLTQSILQLLRQRTPTTTSNPNQTFSVTTPFPISSAEDPIHNVNDVAAGLDTITVDVPPVFDSMPLE